MRSRNESAFEQDMSFMDADQAKELLKRTVMELRGDIEEPERSGHESMNSPV